MPRLFRSFLVGGLLCGCCASWLEAAPSIQSLSVRALRRGAPTTVVIDGAELLPEPRLLTSAVIARQTVKPNPTAQRVEVEVELALDAAVGFHTLRFASASGVSNPVVIAVDDVPAAPFAADIAALPIALHGALEGGGVLRTSFAGSKDARLVVDIEARRLGGKLSPVLRLLDASGRQLAYAMPLAALRGDARLDVRLPADGRYTIEIQDMLFRGEAPGFFRLKVGDLSYADQVFPLAVFARGAAGSPTALLPLGGGFAPDARATLDYRGPAGAIRPPLPSGKTIAAGQAWLEASEFPEAVEGPPTNPPAPQQVGPAPVGINGRLGLPGEDDRYLVAVAPGVPLKIECFASRVGSPIDAVLTVSKPDGGQLAANDDRPGLTDPGLDFTPPAGVTAIVVSIKDLTGAAPNGGPYRVTVIPANRPTFRLTLAEDRQLVSAGGAAVFRVKAERQNYAGAIKLTPSALPPGMNWIGESIPAGANEALVALTAPAGATSLAAVISLRGESVDPASPGSITEALLGETEITRLVPAARSELAVATTVPAAVNLAWIAAADEKLPLGGKLPFRVQAARGPNVQGAVRLSLLSTHTPPKKTVKVDNKDQQVDDLDRALRFEGAPTIAADQAEAAGAILIPADMPAGTYDLAIKAELLSADGKAVIAACVTTPRRLQAAK